METRYLGVLVSFLLVLSLGLTFAQMRAPAQDCVPENCTLPNCRCFSTEIPQNLSKSETPQLVFISFDAAVSVDNFNFYREVLFSRKNPNGQPITVTFFVAHDYTNYSMVHELYRNGHEIGLHSISANTSQAYWQSLNATMWRRELVDQREQLSTFAKIPPAEIYGSRAQQLILGGDDHYDVLNQARIKYDCSRPAIDYRTVGLWPYTNDYKASQTCYPDPSTCPTGEHKGFWTVPIVPLTGDNGAACSLVDQCEPVPTTANETYAMLTRNFNNHYQGHRAPFGLYLRHGWVNGTGSGGDDEYIWERRAGFVRFLDDLANKSDVYIVSIYRGLQWVQDPTPLAQIDNFAPFNVNVKASQCRQAFSCEYRAGQTPFKPPLSQERVFSSCITCPTAYPWVGNHLGRNPYT